MNKHIIITLSLFSSLHGMDQPVVVREPREWNAQAYANGNTMQTSASKYFFEKNNIVTQGRKVLSIGCGTGERESHIAETAKCVYGIDASQNMIHYAKETHKNNNLSFQHCFVEDFTTKKLYQLAYASCCFHWFADKKLALRRIHGALEKNGEFFADIQTDTDPAPLNLVVYEDMKRSIPIIGEYLAQSNDPTGSSRPNDRELHDMLHETGFKILKYDQQSFECVMTKQDMKLFQWPIIASRPGIKYIPNMFIQSLFENFIDRCLAKLQENKDGTYTYTYTTKIIHARKR